MVEDTELDGRVTTRCTDFLEVGNRLLILPHFVNDMLEGIRKNIWSVLIVLCHVQ